MFDSIHRGKQIVQSPPCLNGQRRGFISVLFDVTAYEALTFYGEEDREGNGDAYCESSL